MSVKRCSSASFHHESKSSHVVSISREVNKHSYSKLKTTLKLYSMVSWCFYINWLYTWFESSFVLSCPRTAAVVALRHWLSSFLYIRTVYSSLTVVRKWWSFRGGNRSDDVRTTLRPYMGILEFKIFCTMSKVQNRHTGVLRGMKMKMKTRILCSFFQFSFIVLAGNGNWNQNLRVESRAAAVLSFHRHIKVTI